MNALNSQPFFRLRGVDSTIEEATYRLEKFSNLGNSRNVRLRGKPRAILSLPDAIATLASATKVAQLFRVSEKAIRDIWTGRTWASETLHLDTSRPLKIKHLGLPIGGSKSPLNHDPLQRNESASNAYVCTPHEQISVKFGSPSNFFNQPRRSRPKSLATPQGRRTGRVRTRDQTITSWALYQLHHTVPVICNQLYGSQPQNWTTTYIHISSLTVAGLTRVNPLCRRAGS